MKGKSVSRREFLRTCAAAVAGAAMAAGCQQPAPQATSAPKTAGEPESPTQVTERVTIRFCGRSGNEEDIYRERAVPFQEEYPNIEVKMEMFPSADYHQKMQVMYAGGTAGDVVYDVLASGYYYLHCWQKQFLALDDIVAQQGFDLNPYYPSVIEAARYEGQLYCLPRNCHPGWCGLYYNKALFREAGIEEPAAFDNKGSSYGDWTLDQFLEMAQALTKDTNGDGKVDQFGALVETTLQSLTTWVRGFKGWEISEDGKKFELGSAEGMEAVKYVYDLFYTNHVAPTPSEQIDMMFDSGRVAMWLTGVWGKRARGRVGDRFEIGGVPMAKGPAGYIGLGSIFWFDPLAIYKGTEHPDAAFEWVKWMTNQESGIRLAENGMAPGARPDVWESPRLVGDPLTDMYKVVMDEVLPYRGPSNFRATEVNNTFQGIMDRLWLGQGTPEEIVPEAVTAVQQVLDKPREEA